MKVKKIRWDIGSVLTQDVKISLSQNEVRVACKLVRHSDLIGRVLKQHY